jgi:hypothetical protein
MNINSKLDDYFSNNDFLSEFLNDGNYELYFDDDNTFLDPNDNLYDNINEDFGNNYENTNTSYQNTPSNAPLTPSKSNKINFPQNKNKNFFFQKPITSINNFNPVINNITPILRPQLQQPFITNSYPSTTQKNLSNNNFNNRIFPQNPIPQNIPSQKSYLQKFESKKNEFYRTICKKINTSALNFLKFSKSDLQSQIIQNLTKKKLNCIETEIFIITQNFKTSFSKKFSEILKTQNFTMNTINRSFNEYFNQYSKVLKNSEIKTQMNFKNEITEYLKTNNTNNRINDASSKHLFGFNIFKVYNDLELLSNKKV